MPTSRPLPVLCPERLRRPPKSFAWLDHRLRANHVLASLSGEEIGLYVFLVLAADAQGLSCWRLDRIERELPFEAAALRRAREGLLRADLLAYQPWSAQCPDGCYQLLALPAPITAPVVQGCVSLGQCLASVSACKR